MDKQGPVYGVDLIVESLEIGSGMRQAMASRDDLVKVKRVSERTAAAYEVLCEYHRQYVAEIERYAAFLRSESGLTFGEWISDRGQWFASYDNYRGAVP